MTDRESGVDPIARRRVAMCRALIKERKRIGVHLGFELCPVPAWDIFLDLYLAHHESRATQIWSLCMAANIPTSTAHRKIGEMAEDGILVRGSDGGKVTISLSAAYLAKLDCLLDDLLDLAVTTTMSESSFPPGGEASAVSDNLLPEDRRQP